MGAQEQLRKEKDPVKEKKALVQKSPTDKSTIEFFEAQVNRADQALAIQKKGILAQIQRAEQAYQVDQKDLTTKLTMSNAHLKKLGETLEEENEKHKAVRQAFL